MLLLLLFAGCLATSAAQTSEYTLSNDKGIERRAF